MIESIWPVRKLVGLCMMHLMFSSNLKSDGLLLVSAIIWGFAFVAQRIGMEYVGPFTFNAVRFSLGAVALLPFLHRRPGQTESGSDGNWRVVLLGGSVAGVVLFAGSTLQQIGIIYTTAGKAGFITGLYVIIVPIIGLCLGKKTGTGTWAGALLAVVGMYLLSITDSLSIGRGDLLVLIGAFFWAGHVVIIGRLSGRVRALNLAIGQFLTCSALSLIGAIIFEEIVLSNIIKAIVPILYAGLLSVGIAYTFQVFAQRKANPAHAAIILSLESVFAVIGGMIILGERLSAKGSVGCVLMLAGMLLSQLSKKRISNDLP